MDTASCPTCDKGVILQPCTICKVNVQRRCWVEETNAELDKHQCCFQCGFWLEKVGWKTNSEFSPRIARIDGKHYLVNPDPPEGTPNWGYGHGGTRFHIQFMDGRAVTTRNLWCQGYIPDHFKTDLPDNAAFVSPSK